jgi:alpha-tubulin suppressor-like RCC1 family protein
VYNQLGEALEDVLSPKKINLLSGIRVTQITCSVNISYALARDGILYSLGENSQDCGRGTKGGEAAIQNKGTRGTLLYQ